MKSGPNSASRNPDALTQTLFEIHSIKQSVSQTGLGAFHRDNLPILRAGKAGTRRSGDNCRKTEPLPSPVGRGRVSSIPRKSTSRSFSGVKGSEQQAFLLNPDAKGEEKQDVRALFSATAPPAPLIAHFRTHPATRPAGRLLLFRQQNVAARQRNSESSHARIRDSKIQAP